MRPLQRTSHRIQAALAALTLACGAAQAVEVRFEPVVPGVFAFVGETGGRTADNEGLNANIGLVVTNDGALLIDSGASWQGARQIHEAVRRVTPQPVKWVINTGGQDHRWLGNGYFQAQGAQLMGHANGRSDMLNRGNDQLTALRAVLGPKLDGTQPVLPNRWLDGESVSLRLGGTALEVKHAGGAHTPGDLMVWLPEQRVLFTGDVVYVDRILGVIPVSHTGRWMKSFAIVESLKPAVVVPGHGRVSDLARARADTHVYLQALRTHMKKAVNEATDISAAIKAFDAGPFMRLHNAADLHPGNASRTYLELELE
jgi:glyoxylase-like metal-dependent hydrolase (beta-lactamase superfamily II)